MSNYPVTEQELRLAPPPDSVIRLVEQVVAGNGDAEEAFYSLFQPLVSRWIRKLAGKRTSPVPVSLSSKDDALQKALIRLIYGDARSGAPGKKESPLRKWLDYEGAQRMSLYRYVHTNVEFFFKDFASAYAAMRTRESPGLEPVVGQGQDKSLERRIQRNRCLEDCLNDLSPTAREIIVRVYYEGYSQAETARMLGMSGPTFSRHCRKAVEQFSELVMQKCPEDLLLSVLMK